MFRFKTGNFYMTIGINNAIKQSNDYFNELVKCFERYLKCDWGDLTEADIIANERALINGNRILGAYNTSQGKVYIITEADRSYTTILFATEY